MGERGNPSSTPPSNPNLNEAFCVPDSAVLSEKDDTGQFKQGFKLKDLSRFANR